MKPSFYVLLSLTLLLCSCKNDKVETLSTDAFIGETEDTAGQPKAETRVLSKTLYAKLDRLKIRTDSTLNSKTALVISEGDTLVFQDVFSTSRENLKLRGKNYYEPWLKVLHPKSGKLGWVYGGAVIYDSKELKQQHDKASPLLAQVYADDLEWDGTVPAAWSAATISNPEEFKLFLIGFKGMVANNDIDQLANLIEYPMKDIQNKSDFKGNYARLFTEEIKEAIADQRLDRIFRNSKGANLGNGAIWFRQVGSRYKIVNINFKGRSDVTKELMSQLSGQYISNSSAGKQSVKALTIKEFLELTLNYQGPGGFPESRSLGRFLHETSQNGQHSFYQDTNDSLKRRLMFMMEDSTATLKVANDTQLEGVEFLR